MHKLIFVSIYRSFAKITCKDERSDSGDKSRKEGVEGESSDEKAVNELRDSGEQDVEHIGVDDLQSRRSRLQVIAEELSQNVNSFNHLSPFRLVNLEKHTN